MKKKIHPKINKINVKCTTCGNEFETSSVANEIKIDVCSKCHPFYTGKQTSGSKTGRVDKFNKKLLVKKDSKNQSKN